MQNATVSDAAAEGAMETIGPRRVGQPDSAVGSPPSSSGLRGDVSWGLLAERPSLDSEGCSGCGHGHMEEGAVAASVIAYRR